MKLTNYIKDKAIIIFINIVTLILLIMILIIFQSNEYLTFLLSIIYILTFLFCFLKEYMERRKFYQNFSNKLNKLDQKYLIHELEQNPSFLEGQLLLEYLYEINKAFIEEKNTYKFKMEEFKEYIELWCHQIKTPLATSKLIIENNKNKTSLDILEEINTVEVLIEQVLFYARSDNPEKDYIIKKTHIKKIIQNVIKSNKKSLINKNIKVKLDFEDTIIASDSKWLEFIINQIVYNSIKYSKENAYIKFFLKEEKNNITLFIEDNGIGIKPEEIPRVFDKGFTGSNGRDKYNSTGIGLYLCKKLCNKLGHTISITSNKNIGTTVTITFPNNSLITDIK